MSIVTRERPILFSAPMVRAILAGRKTQTRRVIMPQPVLTGNDCWEFGDEVYISAGDLREHLFHNVYGAKGSPYGSLHGTGADRLWIREAFCRDREAQNGYRYRASDPIDTGPWKPSIHMPRQASRITLELTDVQIERLQDITEADARAEGFSQTIYRDGRGEESARSNFRATWEQLNLERGYGWEVNPWVWQIDFKRVE